MIDHWLCSEFWWWRAHWLRWAVAAAIGIASPLSFFLAGTKLNDFLVERSIRAAIASGWWKQLHPPQRCVRTRWYARLPPTVSFYA
jgi:hypothetical protein